MSKRERLLVWLTLSVVGLFLADRVLVAPVAGWYQARSDQAVELEQDIERARGLVQMRSEVSRLWQGYRNAGLGRDASALTAEVNASLSAWAQQAGLTLSGVRPARQVEVEAFQEMGFVVSADGSAGSAAAFLARIESSPLPMKVSRVDFSASNAEEDRVQLQVTLSTLRLTGAPAPTSGSVAASASGSTAVSGPDDTRLYASEARP
ncbi:MAG: hypothetical protein AAF288_04995 [Planctomycetota bacterium]